MTHFWSFFIRRKQFSTLVIISLVIASILSVIAIPKESAPEVNIPYGIVTTVLPGASAFDVERLVTDTIEDGLLGSLEGVREITSTSQNSVSSVVVEFEASVDLDTALQDLRDAVDRVESNLPESAEDPSVLQIDFSSQPVLTFAIAADRPESELLRLGTELERDLLTIRGVSDITISGARDREVQVLVDPSLLALHDLQVADVIAAIDRNNRSFPVGSIEFDGVSYVVEFSGNLEDPEELFDATITTQAGTVLYLRDIATITDGYTKESTRSRISVDGTASENALTFNVVKATNADITSVTSLVNDRLDALQEPEELLEGVTVLRVLDTGEFLLRDLRSLSFSGMQSIALVILILLVTLGWREALIAGTAIPLSFMIGFIGLYVSGNTINFLSLFSLILSIGILVDSAIVVVEGIHTRMKEDPSGDKESAAIQTISSFNLAITAGTMTTVAVFAPLFFISGITGEFIKSIPFTLIAVLFASLFVALGIVPLFASLFLRRRSTSTLEERQEALTTRMQESYRERLATLLGNRKRERLFVWSVIAVFFITLIFPVIGLVKVEFFPVGNEDFLIVEIELPEGSTLNETDLVLRSVEEVLYEVPFVESFTTTSGAGSAFTGDIGGGGGGGAPLASALLLLNPERTNTASEVAQDIRTRLTEIKGADIRVTLPEGGPPVGTPIVVTLSGESLADLRVAAEQVETLLYDIEGTTAITSSMRAGIPQFTLSIDRAKAATLGVEPGLIAQTMRTTVQGSTASVIRRDGEEIEIVVKLAHAQTDDPHATNQLSIDELTALEVRGAHGLVPLSSVLTTELEESVASISHKNGARIASVGSNIEAGANVAQITNTFEQRVQSEISLPPGVTVSTGGENEEVDQSFAEMGVAAIAGLVLMFAILVLQFNSFRHALYVLSVAPLSLTGIFLGLALTGQPLSFPSLLGFIALSGIVVNNSILLITVINELRREDPDRDIREIILDGATSRLRPILLTTLTTVIGVIPLMFVDPLWAPLALALIFGLSFAVVITLALIPILYSRKPGKVS